MANILTVLRHIKDKLSSWKEAAGWVADRHPRYPKGHKLAGKFMPKGAQASGGTSKEIKKEGPEGTAKAPQKETVVRGKRAGASGVPWIKKGDSYEFKYSKFKDMDEAKSWLKDNIAISVIGMDEMNVGKMNACLSHLRVIADAAPLKEKIDTFQFHSQKTRYLGQFTVSLRKMIGIGNDSDVLELRADKISANMIPPSEKLRKAAKALSNRANRLERGQERRKKRAETKGGKVGPNVSNVIEHCRQKAMEINKEADAMAKTGDRGNVKERPIDAYDNPMAGALVHEYGHAWHSQNMEKVKTNLGIFFQGDVKGRHEGYVTSPYSKKDQAELFAEAFTVYMLGETKHLHADLTTFFDKEFPKLNFGGTAKRTK